MIKKKTINNVLQVLFNVNENNARPGLTALTTPHKPRFLQHTKKRGKHPERHRIENHGSGAFETRSMNAESRAIISRTNTRK